MIHCVSAGDLYHFNVTDTPNASAFSAGKSRGKGTENFVASCDM